MGKIFSYYVSNGTVIIKIQETLQTVSIMHTSDLDKLFPDVDLRVQQYDGETVLHWYHQRGIWGPCSVWDGPLCGNIYRQEAVRYCHREPSLGSSGYPDSTPGYYVVKHMLCSSFLLVLLVCFSPHPICFWFQN